MEKMKPFRTRIDALDNELVDLLCKRIAIIHEVAHFKHENNIPAVLQDRIDEVRERAAQMATDKDSDPEIVRELYARIIKYSCDLEEEIMDALDKKASELS